MDNLEDQILEIAAKGQILEIDTVFQISLNTKNGF